MRKSILLALSGLFAFSFCIGEANAFGFSKKKTSSHHTSKKSTRFSKAKSSALSASKKAKSGMSSLAKSAGRALCRGICNKRVCGTVPVVGYFCKQKRPCGGVSKNQQCVAAAEKLIKAAKQKISWMGAAVTTKKISEKSPKVKAFVEKLMCSTFCNVKFCKLPQVGKQLGAMCAAACDNSKIEACLKAAGIPSIKDDDLDSLADLLEESDEATENAGIDLSE